MNATEKQLNEVSIIQNPALGAYLLWRFSREYFLTSAKAPNFLTLFLILPLVLHESTLKVINSTNISSGLSLLSNKLASQKLLMPIHTRVLSLRLLTLESISLACQKELLTVDHTAANVYPKTSKTPSPKQLERIKPLINGADKLGHWFAQLNLREISSNLRIDF